MTLAGTRPPTVDEWDKYELHHRARLATKPGLTGMWQVSGRSNITDLPDEDDFEEFQEDFIEDMGYISKKYDFIGIVGRPRKWQKEFVTEIQYSSEDFSFKEILRKNELTDKELIRRGDILISLATGSIR